MSRSRGPEVTILHQSRGKAIPCRFQPSGAPFREWSDGRDVLEYECRRKVLFNVKEEAAPELKVVVLGGARRVVFIEDHGRQGGPPIMTS